MCARFIVNDATVAALVEGRLEVGSGNAVVGRTLTAKPGVVDQPRSPGQGAWYGIESIGVAVGARVLLLNSKPSHNKCTWPTFLAASMN